MADPPVADPPVVPPPRGQVQHAAGVTDGQGADPLLHGPVDDRGGGFVLGLGHPAAVPCLCPPLAAPVLAPAPRPPLARFRRPAGRGAVAGLGISVVQVVLGADRPPGHQQPLRVRPGDRVRVMMPRSTPATRPGSGSCPGG
jgi:hypothetical protein